MEKIPYMKQMMPSVKEPVKFKLNKRVDFNHFFSLGSLRNDVFERRMSTGSEHSALLSRGFEQFFGHIVFMRVKTLSKTHLVVSSIQPT